MEANLDKNQLSLSGSYNRRVKPFTVLDISKFVNNVTGFTLKVKHRTPD